MAASIMVVPLTEPVTPSGIRPDDDEEKYAAEGDPYIPHNINPFRFDHLFGSR
jgi:hypothetical protein